MAAAHLTLSNPEYLNWVTVGRAIQVTKQGIEKLIQNAIDAYHATLIGSLPHSTTSWKSHLGKAHRSPDKKRICWANCDCKKWFTHGESWEVAKVFMAPLGSRTSDVTTAETSDLSGLLNVLEWCPRGHGGVFATGVSIPAIAAARGARNLWAHSPNLEISDPEKADAFKFLELLLRDPELFSDKHVQMAVNELTRLSTSGLTVLEKKDRDILVQFKNEIGQDFASLESNVTEWKEQVEVGLEKIRDQVKAFNELVNKRVDSIEEKFASYVESTDSRFEEIEAQRNANKNSSRFARAPVISFNPVCERMKEEFVGREWLFSKVNNWLDKHLKPKEARTFIVWGAPGTGKSLWAREMIRRERKPAAYHFCQNDNPVTCHLPSLTENLSNMLAANIPEYSKRTSDATFHKLVKTWDDAPEKQFDLVITTPLQQLQTPETHYLLVDGLDEGGPAISSCLAKLSTKLPSCIRIILTSRHGAAAMSNLFSDSCSVSLDELVVNEDYVDGYLLTDMREFVMQKFEKLQKEHDAIPPFFASDEETSIENIVQASKQCFLYAKLVMEDLYEGKIELTLPASLSELYYLEFRRLFPKTDYYEQKVAPIIEIVLALRQLDAKIYDDVRKTLLTIVELTPELSSLFESLFNGRVGADSEGLKNKEFSLISRVTESSLVPELDKKTLKKILKSLSSYLIYVEDIRYSFSHSSVVEFLKDESSDYFCDATAGHGRLTKYYLRCLKNERANFQPVVEDDVIVHVDDSKVKFVIEDCEKHFVNSFDEAISNYFYHSSFLPESQANCVAVLTDELKLRAISLLGSAIDYSSNINSVLIANFLLSNTDILDQLDLDLKSQILIRSGNIMNRDITAKIIDSGYWLFSDDLNVDLLATFLSNYEPEDSQETVLQRIAPGRPGTDDTYIDFFLACTRKKGSFPQLLFCFMCLSSRYMQHYVQYFFAQGDNPNVAVPLFYENTHGFDRSICWNKDVEKYFQDLKVRKKTVITIESLKERPHFLKMNQLTLRIIQQSLSLIEEMIKEAKIFLSFIYGWHCLIREQGDESLSCMEFLVKNGANVNAIGDSGETGLIIAAMSGYIEIAKFLLESGADVNQRDFFGSTALHFAVCKHGQEKAVQAKTAYETSSIIFQLLRHGADPLIRNSEGLTAIAITRLSMNRFHYDLLTGEIN